MAAKKVQDHEVADEAYKMWIDAGKPDGMAEEHWHRAKAKLEARDTFEDGPKAAKAAPKPKAKPVAKPAAKAAPKVAAKAAKTSVKTTGAAAPKPAPKARASKPKAK